jgi:hypothetical protein
MAVKKGLLVGVAVGGVLYVMWRRRRRAEAPPEPAPAWQPPPPPPVPVAEEPLAEEPIADEGIADEEITEELDDPEPPPGQPAPHVVPAVEEPAFAPVAPPRREEPTLRHPGRRVPLSSSGFAAKPRVAAFRTSDRPQPAQARISWPGSGGPAAQRPKPLRLVPARSRPASLRRSR